MIKKLHVDSQNVLIRDGFCYANYSYNKQNAIKTGEGTYSIKNEHLRYEIKTDLNVKKSKSL